MMRHDFEDFGKNEGDLSSDLSSDLFAEWHRMAFFVARRGTSPKPAGIFTSVARWKSRCSPVGRGGATWAWHVSIGNDETLAVADPRFGSSLGGQMSITSR
jgi:hypothetical protein